MPFDVFCNVMSCLGKKGVVREVNVIKLGRLGVLFRPHIGGSLRICLQFGQLLVNNFSCQLRRQSFAQFGTKLLDLLKDVAETVFIG